MKNAETSSEFDDMTEDEIKASILPPPPGYAARTVEQLLNIQAERLMRYKQGACREG